MKPKLLLIPSKHLADLVVDLQGHSFSGAVLVSALLCRHNGPFLAKAENWHPIIIGAHYFGQPAASVKRSTGILALKDQTPTGNCSYPYFSVSVGVGRLMKLGFVCYFLRKSSEIKFGSIL